MGAGNGGGPTGCLCCAASRSETTSSDISKLRLPFENGLAIATEVQTGLSLDPTDGLDEEPSAGGPFHRWLAVAGAVGEQMLQERPALGGGTRDRHGTGTVRSGRLRAD